jgi:tetratricopeptide (TPR) repeat protein
MRKIIILIFITLPIFAQATNIDTLILDANKYWKAGKMKQAEQSYLQALKLNEKSLAIHLKLGALYLNQHRLKESIYYFQRALSLDTNNAKLFTILGIAYWHNGAYSLAQATFQQALKIGANQQEAKKLLKRINKKLNHHSKSGD